MLRSPNCFKFVAEAEFLLNEREAYRSSQKQPELNLSQCCVAVKLVRPLHVSKVGQSKKRKTKQATLISDFHAHGSSSSLWPIRLVTSSSSLWPIRFVWRGVNIDDVTIHPSRGSRIKPTLKVCEHNRVAHASAASSLRKNFGNVVVTSHSSCVFLYLFSSANISPVRFVLHLQDWWCVGKRETSFPVNKLWLIYLPPSLWP